MEIIEDFQVAKSALSRQNAFEFYDSNLEPVVRQIVDEVRNRGDAALVDYTLEFDGIKLTQLEISKQQIASAYQEVDKELVSALKLAAERISSFHLAQRDLG